MTPARPAESFEEPFAALEELMRTNGGPKPVWITEWGCYADDDPACVPESVGDATMNRCRWPSERAATEHIVKFTAVSFAHGVRKIFFHAGTCGTINGPDAGGVLFEYGGAPRKMYAGVAALTALAGRARCMCEDAALGRRVGLRLSDSGPSGRHRLVRARTLTQAQPRFWGFGLRPHGERCHQARRGARAMSHVSGGEPLGGGAQVLI